MADPNSVLIGATEVVKIHLDTLEGLLASPTPGIPESVRASLSLRFLFDGALNRVAHASGVELKILAPELDNVPIGQAILFACGGYELGGERVQPYYLYREPGKNSAHRPRFEKQVAASPNTHTYKEFKLGKFCQLPCVSFVGETLGREEMVRYVANKCGGAHHHDDMKKFDEIDIRLTSVGHVLQHGTSGISVVFLETLGTAWFLLNSPSISVLRKLL